MANPRGGAPLMSRIFGVVRRAPGSPSEALDRMLVAARPAEARQEAQATLGPVAMAVSHWHTPQLLSTPDALVAMDGRIYNRRALGAREGASDAQVLLSLF